MGTGPRTVPRTMNLLRTCMSKKMGAMERRQVFWVLFARDVYEC